MSTSSTRLPEGRYGRSSDQRADRTLKVVGAVLSVLLLGLIGWFGYYYVAQNEISAEVIGFDVSDDAVKVHLEVHKDAGVDGYCTVRSQAENGAEVGRADFRFDKDATRVDEVVTLRTTSRATSAELVGCHAE
ncbi:membrane protein [Streptomyces malachitofuscus]|nr:membrane protein [Streptomyces malachitofuscus]